ncbi:hypothetical protein pb186bvf_004044 [Paramecium bursaria]
MSQEQTMDFIQYIIMRCARISSIQGCRCRLLKNLCIIICSIDILLRAIYIIKI